MPTWATILLEVAKAVPGVFRVIADALDAGDTPEQAIAKARAVAPDKLDTKDEDAERRARLRGNP